MGDMKNEKQAPESSVLQLIRQQQQDNDGLQNKDIGQALLMAGFLADTKFIDFVDARLPKTGKTDKIVLSHGQVLAILLVVLFSGQYRSLLSLQGKLSKLAIHGLLGLAPEIRIEDISRDVCSFSLDVLWEYGCAQLFEEYGAAVYKQYNLGECTEAHLDSTNYITYHSESPADLAETPEDAAEIAAQDPDEVEILERVSSTTSEGATSRKEPRLTYGKSKDGHHELALVSVYNFCDGHTGIPLLSVVKDGNASDKTVFAELAKTVLPALQKYFSSLKYLVADSAFCTEESFKNTIAAGVHVVTRMPDSFTVTKQVMDKYPDPYSLEPIYDEDEWHQAHGKTSEVPRGLILKGLSMWGLPLTGLLVFNPNLKQTKGKTLNKRATKEKEALAKAVKHKFKCEADAQQYIHDLEKSAKYCTITDVEYKLIEVNERKGAPSKDPAKNKKKLKEVRTSANVCLDLEKIEELVQSECYYLLVTTDVERHWSKAELLECYKRNSVVENLWRHSKNKRLFLSRFFFKSEHRVETILWLVHVGLIAFTVMENLIQRAALADEFHMPDQEHRSIMKKPTCTRVIDYLKDFGPSLRIDSSGIGKVVNITNVTVELCQCLGETWLQLLLEHRYTVPQNLVPNLSLNRVPTGITC